MLTTLRLSLSRIETRPRIRTLHSSYTWRNGLKNILGDLEPPAVQIRTITAEGLIELANGMRFPGPVVFLGGKVFLWDVPTSLWEGWNMDRFKIFEVVVPKPEILLVGTGSRMVQLPQKFRSYLHSIGVHTDVMATKNACSTYNLLVEEGRNVAAALLPLNLVAWKRKSS